jgi:thiol-disulfide isomerase/thioredoxin
MRLLPTSDSRRSAPCVEFLRQRARRYHFASRLVPFWCVLAGYSLIGDNSRSQEESATTSVTISGRIVDAEGRALAAAELRSSPRLTDAPLDITDDEGRFRFEVDAGTQLFLIVISDGCVPSLQKLVVNSDKELQIQLRRSPGLKLRVVDPEGRPIAGVHVHGDDWRDFALIHEMTTDVDGRVDWAEAPDDPMEFLITREGFSPLYNLRLEASGTKQTITMTRIVRVLVRARDAESRERLDSFVAVPLFRSDGDTALQIWRSRAVSTANGEATLDLHESDSRSCQIRVEAPGCVVSQCPVDFGEAPKVIDIDLRRADDCRGTVIDSAGKPVENATVSLANGVQAFSLRRPDGNYSVATDKQGQFAFPRELGDCIVLVQSNRGFAKVRCREGDWPISIQLQSWARISGSITHEGRPIKNHLVALSDFHVDTPDQPRIDLGQFTSSDERGRFTFDLVPPGNYAVRANQSIFRVDGITSAESLPITVGAGDRVDRPLGVDGAIVSGQVRVANDSTFDGSLRWSLNYLLPKNLTVQPRISPGTLNSHETNGVPIENEMFWRTSEGAAALRGVRHWQFKLDDEGTYSISGVPAGDYRLHINLYEPPVDGCLAAPISSNVTEITVENGQSEVQCPPISMQVQRTLKPGSVVPDFEFTRLDGTTTMLSALRGNVVMLQVWATWCGPCLAELPDLQALAASHSGPNCVILGLNIDEPDRDITSFVNDRQMDWPQGRLPLGLDSPVLRQLSVSSIPVHMVIDADGVLLCSHRSLEEAEAVIRSAVAVHNHERQDE